MKNNFLLILTFFYCTLTWAQVKFEAEVSKNKLGVNENLRIDFKMNKDGCLLYTSPSPRDRG